MNVKLLRKVKKHILAEPKRFDMGVYVGFVGNRANAPPCGTTACIAGWAYLLTEKIMPEDTQEADKFYQQACSYAPRILGIRKPSAARLVHVGNWPEKFKEAFHAASTRIKEAKVAAARIEHFIKTKGRE